MGGLAGRLDAQAVGDGHGHRLFEEQVLAGFEGGDGELGMGVVGGGDGQDVDVRIGEQPRRVGGVPSTVVFPCQRLGGRRVDVAEGAHGRVGLGGRPARVGAAGGAAADEAPAERGGIRGGGHSEAPAVGHLM